MKSSPRPLRVTHITKMASQMASDITEETTQAPAGASLKRVDSKVMKMYNTQTGYVEGDYTGVTGRFLDLWRNNFVCRLARVVGPRFVCVLQHQSPF